MRKLAVAVWVVLIATFVYTDYQNSLKFFRLVEKSHYSYIDNDGSIRFDSFKNYGEIEPLTIRYTFKTV